MFMGRPHAYALHFTIPLPSLSFTVLQALNRTGTNIVENSILQLQLGKTEQANHFQAAPGISDHQIITLFKVCISYHMSAKPFVVFVFELLFLRNQIWWTDTSFQKHGLFFG